MWDTTMFINKDVDFKFNLKMKLRFNIICTL